MTMKAAQYKEYGNSDLIEIIETVVPKPGVGQVLVEIHASAVNPFDYKLRRGYMKEMIPLQFPATIGADFSGVISEVSGDVSGLKPGDEVYGSAIIIGGGSGATAQYATAKVQNISLKPKNLSHQEAAALVLVGISATQAIEEHIKLQSGQKILIHGGSGGIGSTAIQLAKHIGAYVATTVRGDHAGFIKSLGADEIVDYEQAKFEEKLYDYDAVIDTVGGDTYKRSFVVLRDGGIIVSLVEQPEDGLTSQRGITSIYQQSHTDTASLAHLAELADNGIIKPSIDKVFTLDQAAEAFEYTETGHPKGKVVIEIR